MTLPVMTMINALMITPPEKVAAYLNQEQPDKLRVFLEYFGQILPHVTTLAPAEVHALLFPDCARIAITNLALGDVPPITGPTLVHEDRLTGDRSAIL